MVITCSNCCAEYKGDNTRLMHKLIMGHGGCCFQCGQVIPTMKVLAHCLSYPKPIGGIVEDMRRPEVAGMFESAGQDVDELVARLLKEETSSKAERESHSGSSFGPPLAPA